MRFIDSEIITEKVAQEVSKINYYIDNDILNFFSRNTSNPKEKFFLNILKENAEIAKNNQIPLCQDTGLVVVFVKLGIHVHLPDTIENLINIGVEKGYKEYYLRKSIVTDPLERINNNTNTPAIIHIETENNDKLDLTIMAKGGGSENASALWMLDPSDDADVIISKITDRIKEKGYNCCPPLFLGIGIGGNLELSTILAKKALTRKIGERNKNQKYANLEKKIIQNINKLNIGVGGFGGKNTIIDAFIETAPCHIASLPLALNINCHSNRHSTISL
jgi:fumarate hydratase subunit alpha